MQLISANFIRALVSISAISLALVSCSGAEKASGGIEAGNTAPVKSGTQDGKEKSDSEPQAAADGGKEGQKTQKPVVATLSDAEIVAKMEMVPFILNNRTGKLFTGFSPGPNFVFTSVVVVAADGIIPKDIQATISPPDSDRIYSSIDFQKKAAALKSKLTLTVDPAFFSVEELPAAEVSSNPNEPVRVFFITSLKAGASNIDLSLEGKKISLAATIAPYTVQQLTDGSARYTTAVAGATPSPSCQSCHGAQGGANHSPTYLSQFGDAAILSTIETGKNSEDGYMTQIAHKMTFATPAQRAGIVAFLRSLPPSP